MLAYPGADGFAAQAIGGRNSSTGKIYIVDRLTDSASPGTGALVDAGLRAYAGDLRYALEASGPRTVVFTTGGQIDLAYQSTIRPDLAPVGAIVITNPYLTVMGETAPGGGITVNGQIFVDAKEIILRHIRLRGNDTMVTSVHDPLITFTGSNPPPFNTMYNHLSLTWGKDNIAGFGGIQDATLSDCIIGPQLQAGGTARGPYVGLPNTANRISFLRNIMYHMPERNPWVQIGDVEIINNVIGARETFQAPTQLGAWYGPIRINHRGNSFSVYSPDTQTIRPVFHYGSSVGPSAAFNAASSIYYNDNYDPVYRPTGAEAQSACETRIGSGTFCPLVGSPVAFSGSYYVAPTVLSYSAAKTHVLGSTGAGANVVRDANANFVEYHDSLDTTTLANFAFTPIRGIRYPASTHPNTVSDSGGFPTLSTGLPLGSAFTDSNGDGIPDSYTLPAGAVWSDLRVDGYTFLEGYVYQYLGLTRYWDDPPGNPVNFTTGSPYLVTALNTPTALGGLSVYHVGEIIDTVDLESDTSNVVLRIGELGTTPTGVTLSVPP